MSPNHTNLLYFGLEFGDFGHILHRLLYLLVSSRKKTEHPWWEKTHFFVHYLYFRLSVE
eukprot:Awhi_evm1s9025